MSIKEEKGIDITKYFVGWVIFAVLLIVLKEFCIVGLAWWAVILLIILVPILMVLYGVICFLGGLPH